MNNATVLFNDKEILQNYLLIFYLNTLIPPKNIQNGKKNIKNSAANAILIGQSQERQSLSSLTSVISPEERDSIPYSPRQSQYLRNKGQKLGKNNFVFISPYLTQKWPLMLVQMLRSFGVFPGSWAAGEKPPELRESLWSASCNFIFRA